MGQGSKEALTGAVGTGRLNWTHCVRCREGTTDDGMPPTDFQLPSRKFKCECLNIHSWGGLVSFKLIRRVSGKCKKVWCPKKAGELGCVWASTHV